MAHRFTRGELYELVWSEPRKTLATRYSVSDVGLSKACRRYDIPVPERGYWAKLKVGKRVKRRPLPHRGPGMLDEVCVGAGNNWWYRNSPSKEEILEATPTPAVFDQNLEEVTAEARARVGHVTIPSLLSRPHRLIAKLLQADEERRKKVATETYVSSWDKPQFDSPFEKRRLKVINAIFTALERCGMKPSIGGREARDLSVKVNDTNVTFSVDDANANLDYHHGQYQQPRNPSGRMKMVIKRWQSPDKIRGAWEDTEDKRIEDAIGSARQRKDIFDASDRRAFSRALAA
ncbi:MAG: hypothetical protein ACI82H_001137 [Alphaproteobacteria bacterium]|jgi:hypothetical protein